MKEIENLKQVVESLLFVTGDPITKTQIQEVVKDISADDIERFIKELNDEYVASGRSFCIEEVAGGWQMRTRPDYAEWVKGLLNIQRRERLTPAALETLAIVAYKQPITKSEVEAIRGVNVDWGLSSLIDKNMVRIVGKKDVVGHPFMYGTTTRFLEHFGLASLKDLPLVSELRGGAKAAVLATVATQEKTEAAE